MRILRARHLAAAIVAGGLLAVSAGTAHAATGAESLALRKAVMRSIATHFGATVAAIKSGDTKRIQAAARQAQAINTLSKSIPVLTPSGSGQAAGKSTASPKIWQDWAGFRKAAATLTEESGKLVAALKSGDAKAAMAQFGRTGKVGCGGCHSTFRVKKKK
jgi:cytochrome c556